MKLIDVEQYFDDIDPDSFQYWCCQDERPTLDDISAFEDTTGFELPSEFRNFTVSRLGGLHLEVPEHIWPRIKGGPFWKFLYGLSVFGLGPEIPPWLDLKTQYSEFRDYGNPDLLPFMRIVSDADRYCFTRSGQIVRWDHETTESIRVDQSFAALLMSEIRALEARKARLIGTDFRQVIIKST